MIAIDLNHGERFRLIENGTPNPDIYECIVTNRPEQWLMYPGVVYRNMRTGQYGGLGPAHTVQLQKPRVERWTPAPPDLWIDTQPDDYADTAWHQPACQNAGTRYDEECRDCHKIKDICNECERCEECHER